MDCHLLATGTRIAPFGDAIGETPVANRPLADWQRDVARVCGLTPADPAASVRGPCILMADDLFVTRRMMQAFLDAVHTQQPSSPVALRVEGSAQLAQTAALQDLDLDEVDEERVSATLPLWYLPQGHEGPPPALEDCQSLPITPRERIERIPVPEQWFGKPELLVPITTQAAMRLRHWSHLIAVNRLAWALEYLDRPKWRQLATLAWAVLRAGIPTRARLLRTLSRIGPGCDIHPTAVIEGSILEPGVRVGPFAVVRFSRLGAGTWVQDHGKVTLSVLGERSMVSAASTINFCMTYPEASASQILMQLSVLGRRAVTTGGGFMMDMRFDREVRVLQDGRVQGTGTRFLGCAVGHDAILGTGFWLAPGRSVPNGAMVVRHPDEVVRSLPTEVEPGSVWVPRGGRLVPLVPEDEVQE